jgi:phage replication O-like protein O
MVSPQIKNGYLKIANEIAEALMKTKLSANQSRIIWAIFRKTYGWNKEEDWISISQFEDMTSIRTQHVSRTLKELREKKIITKAGRKITFNKNYSQWVESTKKVKVTASGKKVTNSGEHNIQINKRQEVHEL